MNKISPVLYVSQAIDDILENYLNDLLKPFAIKLSFNIPQEEYFLQFIDNKVVLSCKNNKEKVFADFVSGRLNHRVNYLSNELIAKAVDIKNNKLIWDATAGLGRDSFVLAALGAKMQMFERHFVPAILLLDAIKRAKEDSQTQEIISRMHFNFGSFSDYSLDLPDVIYIDPMFPERQKSALVKKEMRFFQLLIGEDKDSCDLLHIARKMSVKRIVVKRPKYGDFIGEISPAYQYIGKTTRFDVYLPY